MNEPIRLKELVAFLAETLQKNGDCEVLINTDECRPVTREVTKVYFHEVEKEVYLEA